MQLQQPSVGHLRKHIREELSRNQTGWYEDLYYKRHIVSSLATHKIFKNKKSPVDYHRSFFVSATYLIYSINANITFIRLINRRFNGVGKIHQNVKLGHVIHRF